MHAETTRLADKTIIFSEHEIFKVVVMVTLINMVILLFAHTLHIAVKYGMCLVKHNQNASKSSKTELPNHNEYEQ